LSGVAIVSLSSLVGQAQATFDYSYVFANGVVASGQLTGDQNGNIIDNLNNVSLDFTFGGITATVGGSILLKSWNGSAYVVGGAQISVDGTANDFIFEGGSGFPFFQGQNIGPNNDTPLLTYSYDNSSGDQSESTDYPIISSNWSVTAVPEPTTMAWDDLGGLLAICGLLRRK